MCVSSERRVYSKLFTFVTRLLNFDLNRQVSASLGLPLGSIELVVDEVACDSERSVGVEWHVEWNGAPFPLGRGLSLATLDADGKLVRVVDIAEAPWRVVGLVVRPFLSLLTAVPLAMASLGALWS